MSDQESSADSNAVVRRLCEPVLEANGYELVECVWNRHPRHPAVRLYVHKPGGVTVGDCEKVLRILEPFLQVERVLNERTRLEVASPGLDRALHSARDFRRAEGHLVAVRRRAPDDATREERLVGTVTSITEDDVALLLEEGEVRIRLDQVIEGRFEIRFG
jgi:ribosome maturation factor RimP